MEFIGEYGLFLAKFATVALLFVVAAGLFTALSGRGKDESHGLSIKNINDKYRHMSLVLNARIMPKKDFKKFVKQQKQAGKDKPPAGGGKKIFVLDFKGNIKASGVAALREEITAILTVATDKDEVVALLESAGGTVHGYGLGASQLRRIRDRGIKLTAAVDKVAASGGYMMACVADRIIAAPFAIVGSIGVLAQIPNFHRLLKKMDIDFEQITAGDYKRTLTLFGENTARDREKFQAELEDTHALFKEFVRDNRAQVDLDRIATGEHWYGKRALELQLVDELMTSDDYLSNAARAADIYRIKYQRKKPVAERVIGFGASLFDAFDQRR